MKDHDYLLDISEDAIYLFKVQSTIEIYLDGLFELSRGVEHNTYNKYKNVRDYIAILKNFVCNKVISEKTYETIRDILNICNRGVRGEILNEKYINFVKEIFPIIQKEFDSVYSRWEAIMCPKCKYCGYTEQRNVCPKCGYEIIGY